MRLIGVVVCLVVAVASVRAQIVTGGGRPNPRGVPTLELNTDLGPNRQPTFRAAVTRVQVSVRVLDHDNRPVRGLTADDFSVREGGRPQAISSFAAYRFDPAVVALDDVPQRGLASATTTSVSNARTADARVFALVIDDLHINPRRTERARAIGRELVSRLHPSDLLLVATTSGRETSFTFSRDRVLALRTIDAAFGQRLPDPTSEMLASPGRHAQSSPGGYNTPGLAASQQQRVMQLEMAYETITRVAARAVGIPGRRKTLLYVSEGSPVGSTVNASGQAAGSGSANVALQNAMAAATVADMVVYTVTPTGLDVPGEFLIETNGRAVDESGRDITHQDLTNVIAEYMQTKTQLRDMASLTGGVALIDTNDASGALTRVIDDASEYYVLSYEPEKPAKNDKFRRIDVDVARPDVRLIVRRGYSAPPGLAIDAGASAAPNGLSPALQRLLSAVVAGDALPLRGQLIPLGPGEKGTTRFALALEATGDRLASLVVDGSLDLTLALLTIGENGRLANATRRAMRMSVTDAQLALLQASALRFLPVVDLPHGRHEVRVAVLDERSGVGGSLFLGVVVPDDGMPAGISLASRAWASVPTAFIEPEAAQMLAVPPTALRAFPPNDVLQVTVTAAAVRSATVLDAQGTTRWQHALPAATPAQFDLPLADLPPGPYRLVIGATEDGLAVDFVVLPMG